MQVMEGVRRHRATYGEMFIPSVKSLDGTADHEVDDTVEYEAHRSLSGMLGKEDYGPVKETVSEEGLRDQNPPLPWNLILGIDAEYVRIIGHLTVKDTYKVITFKVKIKKKRGKY
jgi:hypothetical protein